MIKAVVFDYDWVLTRYYFFPQTELFDLAQELRSRGIKTAILSNRPFPFTWLAHLTGKLKGFDTVVFSRQVGKPKPEPGSYEIVVKNLKLKPEECLFVDNRADNVAGAEQLGMTVLWAKSTAQTVEDIKILLEAT